MTTRLRIVSKPGSSARKQITTDTGIQRFGSKGAAVTDAIVNYGLAGHRLDAFYKKFPAARKIPMINRIVGCPKYTSVKQAEEAGILVPETKLSLGKGDKLNEWLIKRQQSIGGIGIKKADSKSQLTGKYYQKFIDNRRYELRVHAFMWTDCVVQKRLGDSKTIAWNFKAGGHFQSIKNPEGYKIFRDAVEVAKQVLELRSMAFGAVDFLVDTDGKLYFIEINASPGFTEFSKHIYVDAFSALAKLNKSQVLKLCK